MKWRWIPGRCRRTRRQLSLLACDALPGSEREAVAAHLAQCGECRKVLAGFQHAARGLKTFAAARSTAHPSQRCTRLWEAAVRADASDPHSPRFGSPRAPVLEAPWWSALPRAAVLLPVIWAVTLGLHVFAPSIPVSEAPRLRGTISHPWLALRATPIEFRRLIHGESDPLPAPAATPSLPPRPGGPGTNSAA